ncbi:hypothetical protein DENSPDRAFT_855146 [Dentipellis sp. KUC8613]|nr:hypothetical protein DENSPDRAFT_855146 [Dentipellis sp. KUC8613]
MLPLMFAGSQTPANTVLAEASERRPGRGSAVEVSRRLYPRPIAISVSTNCFVLRISSAMSSPSQTTSTSSSEAPNTEVHLDVSPSCMQVFVEIEAMTEAAMASRGSLRVTRDLYLHLLNRTEVLYATTVDPPFTDAERDRIQSLLDTIYRHLEVLEYLYAFSIRITNELVDLGVIVDVEQAILTLNTDLVEASERQRTPANADLAERTPANASESVTQAYLCQQPMKDQRTPANRCSLRFTGVRWW